MKGDSGATALAPSIGPALVTLFGHDVPVLALGLSCMGLMLARFIAPPPLRKLTTWQHVALTVLLLIVLFLIVIGAFTSAPMSPGMAVVWGIGLGFSGLLAIEFFAERVLAMLRAMFGKAD